MRRFFFMATVFCLLTSISFAQTDKSFPDDRTLFLKAVTDMFNETKRDDCKQLAQDLEKEWPSINSSQQGDIIELAQAMRTRKMLVTPYFQKYFTTILAFQGTKQSLDLWDQWQSAQSSV